MVWLVSETLLSRRRCVSEQEEPFYKSGSWGSSVFQKKKNTRAVLQRTPERQVTTERQPSRRRTPNGVFQNRSVVLLFAYHGFRRTPNGVFQNRFFLCFLVSGSSRSSSTEAKRNTKCLFGAQKKNTKLTRFVLTTLFLVFLSRRKPVCFCLFLNEPFFSCGAVLNHTVFLLFLKNPRK